MIPPLLKSIAQQKAVGLLEPNWNAMPMEDIAGNNGAGAFVPKYNPLVGKASKIFGAPGSFYQFIEDEAPGMFFDEMSVPNGGRKTIVWPWNRQRQVFDMVKDRHLLDQADKIDDLGSQVFANFRRRFPDAVDPVLAAANSGNLFKERGTYDAINNMAAVDFHPVSTARALAQSSVRSKHPLLTKVLGDTATTVNRAGRWVIPGAMLAGAALRDEIPGTADNRVFDAITKYGPETFLGTSLAASALPALEMKRTMDLLPAGMKNKQFLKAQAAKNAVKILAGYGLLKGVSRLVKKKDKPMEKESAVDIGKLLKTYTYDYGGKYMVAPAILAAALMGLKGVAENTDEKKIPATAAPLFATMSNPSAAAALLNTPGGFE